MIHALVARARSATALVAVAVVVAACGSSTATATPAPATTAPSSAPSAAATGVPSAPATGVPSAPATGVPSAPASPAPSDGSASAAPSDAPLPTFYPVPELEAMMPRSVDGIAFTTTSYTTPTDAQVGPAFAAMLKTLGLTPDARTTAKADSQDPDLKLAFVLYRFEGADPARLLDAFTSSLVEGGVTPSVTEATIGGRAVRTFSTPAKGFQATAYVYSSGEYIYMVLAADPAVAEKAVASWPA